MFRYFYECNKYGEIVREIPWYKYAILYIFRFLNTNSVELNFIHSSLNIVKSNQFLQIILATFFSFVVLDGYFLLS